MLKFMADGDDEYLDDVWCVDHRNDLIVFKDPSRPPVRCQEFMAAANLLFGEFPELYSRLECDLDWLLGRGLALRLSLLVDAESKPYEARIQRDESRRQLCFRSDVASAILRRVRQSAVQGAELFREKL